MEIYRSAGVSTLVALMAAHRARTGRGDAGMPMGVDPGLVDIDLDRLTPTLPVSRSQGHGACGWVSLRQSARASSAFDAAGGHCAAGVHLLILSQP